MTELVSLLIGAFFATSIGIGILSARIKVQDNPVMTKMNAKIDFKQAESRADTEYKVAISDCRKKSPPDKTRCLDDARNVNATAILAARKKMDKVLATGPLPKEGGGAQ